MHASRPIKQRRPPRGFALVLTVTLIAFLAVLLTGFGLLARVEQMVASHGADQAAARQNARMAFAIALGELQRHLGPDQRATATANAGLSPSGTAFYTGVWDTGAPGSAPTTWLVSGGASNPAAVPSLVAGESVVLVGPSIADGAAEVVVPMVEVRSSHLAPPSSTVGHLAWWVGDEGVKASVLAAPEAGAAHAPPFDSPEIRRLGRRQLGVGAGPADSSGRLFFEPLERREAGNPSRVLEFNQLASLPSKDGNELGADRLRRYFHAWTLNHRGVLTDPKRGGLRQDLSLRPDLLGPAFAAWANYAAYMEDPAAPLTPRMAPPSAASPPTESLRRRYRLTAFEASSGIGFGVAPVLSYFLLSFNVRTDQAASGPVRALEARARWLVSLWNPYTSALVPENLELEIDHLPTVRVMNDSDGTASAAISLDAIYGAPLRVQLPWEPAGRDDQQSWLPGRVYTWSAKEEVNKTQPLPAGGFASAFYTRSLSSAAGQGVQRLLGGAAMANAALAHLQGAATRLSLRLYRVDGAGRRELLRSFASPLFEAFVTTPAPVNLSTYQLTYLFHLAESEDTPATPDAWLTTPGQDPRDPDALGTAFLSGANGPRPELYPNYTAISFPDRLLDRALPASAASATGQSYNEDTPLFELPRAPILSLGVLQQLPLPGARPFAPGNSWGAVHGSNAWMDRFFFSGLAPSAGSPATGAEAEPLPNPGLHPAERDAAGRAVTQDRLRSMPDGYSSSCLLQDGAFNVNSVEPAAWLAVLLTARMESGENFSYVNATAASGTADATATLAANPDGVVFYRFPFSAAETYQADAGYAASTSVPNSTPTTPSAARTDLFRRGRRTLSAAQTVALAGRIAELVAEHHLSAGPFRSLEEFLAPRPEWAGRSLLEEAVARAGLNDAAIVPQFSSQWLTAGDLLVTLAPVLAVRSDLFRIRAYGDHVNPASGERAGRAWLEALVQRLPRYVDDSQDAWTRPAELNVTNAALGRRFKVISFRWLDPSDL